MLRNFYFNFFDFSFLKRMDCKSDLKSFGSCKIGTEVYNKKQNITNCKENYYESDKLYKKIYMEGDKPILQYWFTFFSTILVCL